MAELREELQTIGLGEVETYINSGNIFFESAGSKEESDAAMINDNGELIKYDDLSSSQKELYNDYKLVQYDMTAGNNYLENMNFTR